MMLSQRPLQALNEQLSPAAPAATLLPHKFAVDLVTPRKTQDLRGTCWDFATIAVLEQTYRAQGIANGWLAPESYVAFSEQAYGADVLRLCTGPDKRRCYVEATENTTEGGEVDEFFMLFNENPKMSEKNFQPFFYWG